jgi:hypothetical protein
MWYVFNATLEINRWGYLRVFQFHSFNVFLGHLSVRQLRYLWLWYALTIAIFFAVGFYGSMPKAHLSNFVLVRNPNTPPDIEFLLSNLERNASAIVSTKNVVWARERAPDDSIRVHYWCPTESNTWGELVVQWSWDSTWPPALAILDPSLHLFPMFDPKGQGEILLSSRDTGDKWVELVAFDARTIGTTLDYPIDITRWVRNSRELRIKYRIKAERLMYHPTPNDPIGIAGAQCLRQGVTFPYASRLRLWRNKPTD